MSVNKYEMRIKRQVRSVVFKELCEQKVKYKKMTNISYTEFNLPQIYLTNQNFTDNMRSMFCDLRSQCL